MEIKEKHFQFQLSKTEIYNVSVCPSMFWDCREQKTYQKGFNFSFSADVFNRPKTDFNCWGQCQDEVTKGHLHARRFFKKWDCRHLQEVTPELYEEFLKDVEGLKKAYNYIEQDNEITFSQERELSMKKVKKQ